MHLIGLPFLKDPRLVGRREGKHDCGLKAHTYSCPPFQPPLKNFCLPYTTSLFSHSNFSITYQHDPGDPTPWPEFRFLAEEKEKEEKKGIVNIEKRKEMDKKFHKEILKKRKDILVFKTDKLEEETIVVGPIHAIIYASSSSPDTDFFITLNDVDEKGNILKLAKGCFRSRFFESFEKPIMLDKNKIYPFKIDLWHSGILFKKGHRIQTEISSALFPAFSRNLQVGIMKWKKI